MPGQLVVEAEIILDGDRRQRLRLAVDLHAFLGFHRLVQAVAPAAAAHFAARVFVHDHHLVILDDVLHVLLIQAIGAQQLRDIVDALALPVANGLELSPFPRSSAASVRSLRLSMSANAVIRSGSTKASGSFGFRNSRPMLGEIGFVGALVHGEEEFLLQGEEVLLLRVGIEREFGLVEGPAALRRLPSCAAALCCAAGRA